MAHMDGNAETNQVLFEPALELWRRPQSTWLTSITDDLTSWWAMWD